jgi:hypothetical protein
VVYVFASTVFLGILPPPRLGQAVLAPCWETEEQPAGQRDSSHHVGLEDRAGTNKEQYSWQRTVLQLVGLFGMHSGYRLALWGKATD